ncbi:MAG: haloacid dehalogenase type II [Mycobacterium sp.]
MAVEDRIAPRALLFDVQGTATDFRSTVCSEAERISTGRHPHVDWTGFVERWRAGYFAALESAAPDRDNWTTVHSVYRYLLDSLLAEYNMTDFSAAEREELTLSWQRLIPWPDVVPALTRLRERFTLATLSNADVAAVVNISKRAGLRWDAVFTAEMAGVFKPDPAIYHLAARYLGLVPAQIMMVASHKYDIRAAGRLGFQTAFVARPLELGITGSVDTTYDNSFDIIASDFLDLADQLGC